MTRRICVLNTGEMQTHTECTLESAADLSKYMTRALRGRFPGVEFEIQEVASESGGKATADVLWKIGVQVDRAFQEGAWGVIVTHCSDTIEEAAYFLDLVGDFPCHEGVDPVSGANAFVEQNPQKDADSAEESLDHGENPSHSVTHISSGIDIDSSFGQAHRRIAKFGRKVENGPTVVTGLTFRGSETLPQFADLFASCQVALEAKSAEYGVLVVSQGVIHLAREVLKVTSWDADALESPSGGPIGLVGPKGVEFLVSPLPRSFTGYKALVPPVDLVTVGIGTGDRSIKALVGVGSRGLVVESFGYGSLPPSMIEDLVGALKSRVPVVITTRCPFGGAPEPGTVNEFGFVTTDLPGPKARIKLMLALSVTNDPGEIARIFAQYP